ncbi:MAG: hypothetical protein ACE15D_02700 [Candidatus Eisenbacteria bacterium]|nr:hypothetical protein [Candidatus Eisenbacteria bacterium]
MGLATVTHSILAFSTEGSAIAFESDRASANLDCSDIFGNAGGDWVGPLADQVGASGNIAEDPLFCDVLVPDLHLRSDSPCAPDANPDCGGIGALPVACEPPTALQRVTWGKLRALSR